MLTPCFQSPILMLPPQNLESGTVLCTVKNLMNNNLEGWKESIYLDTNESILVTYGLHDFQDKHIFHA